VAVCLFVAGIFLLFSSRTRINFSQRYLDGETWFLGRFRVRSKRHPLVAFTAIVVDERGRQKRSDTGYTCLIGLQRTSGRNLWIRYFSETRYHTPCPEAEALANGWSRDLGLPVKKLT